MPEALEATACLREPQATPLSQFKPTLIFQKIIHNVGKLRLLALYLPSKFVLMKNRPIRILILIAAMFLVLPFTVKAVDPGDPPDIPIDGGASLLAGAAVVYGVKKYKDRKKQKELEK